MVRTVVEEKACECVVAALPDTIRLRHDAAKDRRVPTKPVGVNLSCPIDVGSVGDQPTSHVELIEVHTKVEQ